MSLVCTLSVDNVINPDFLFLLVDVVDYAIGPKPQGHKSL